MSRDADYRESDDLHAILQSVVAYITKILNTRQGSSLLDPDFGIPDFTGVGGNVNSEDIKQFRADIAQTIERNEPRVREVQVDFTPAGGSEASLMFTLNFKLAIKPFDQTPVTLYSKVGSSGMVDVYL